MSQVLWQQNVWYDGKTDGFFLGNERSITNPRCINVQRNTKGLSVSYKSTLQGNFDAIVVAIINLNGVIYNFTNNGKIYRGNTLVYTDPDGANNSNGLINAIVFNGSIYYATYNRLKQVSNATDPVWTVANITDRMTFNRQRRDFKPMYILYDTLYIGDGNEINTLTNLNVATTNVMSSGGVSTIPNGTVISALAYSGVYMRIYGQQNTSISSSGSSSATFPAIDGVQYFWDTISASPTESVKWEDTPIWNAITYGDADYVIAGRYDVVVNWKMTSLYRSSGTSRQLLRNIAEDYPKTYVGQDTPCRFPMLYVDKILHIGAYGGVYTYGSTKKGFPEALSLEYTSSVLDSDKRPDIIVTAMISVNNGTFQYAWKNKLTASPGFSYGIDMVDFTDGLSPVLYEELGIFETNPIFGGNMRDTKSNIELALGFSQLKAGEHIQVFMRKNDIDSRFTTNMIADITTTTHPSVWEAKIPVRGDYQWVQFEVRLYSGTGNLTAPVLYDMELRYDPNLKR